MEQFYVQIGEGNSHSQDVAENMLRFLAMVNEMFKETQLWGLTSLARLVIQNASNWESSWFIIVVSAGAQEYYVEYLLPADKSPWKGAYVKGEAASLEEAKKYLLIAMRESQGWVGNQELARLLQGI
ncbi:hypothetical protein Q5H93_18535 [Hymenobacter sp. ASUV-10]|uniref:Immunity protein Imm1 n=1 Tax=Hymenobacter aranciens TaxID=3063996 RepID=A0ABT9BEQ4_9BACT|nr:hypothetical protein [Hymenobacter sp. ASUV-10]MDO7876749.1 hypothetical protein [Hymenobacter sp. ASUV-10]